MDVQLAEAKLLYVHVDKFGDNAMNDPFTTTTNAGSYPADDIFSSSNIVVILFLLENGNRVTTKLVKLPSLSLEYVI
jgi:hypothetical protein